MDPTLPYSQASWNAAWVRRIDPDGSRANPEAGRGAFRQLTIGVDGTTPLCSDLDFGAGESPDIAPLAVPALAKMAASMFCGWYSVGLGQFRRQIAATAV